MEETYFLRRVVLRTRYIQRRPRTPFTVQFHQYEKDRRKQQEDVGGTTASFALQPFVSRWIEGAWEHWTLLLLGGHMRLPIAVGRCSAGWALGQGQPWSSA
jgi:hypothetical protein